MGNQGYAFQLLLGTLDWKRRLLSW